MLFRGDRGGSDGFVDPVGALREAVNGLVGQDPATLTDGELGADLVRLRQQMDRLEAVMAERTQAANRRGVGLADGHASTPAWIGWKTGRASDAVRKVLRHAELAELLPATGAAWREGAIPSTAVELIAAARVAGCDDQLAAMEREFLDRARRGDVKTLGILTRHFAKCARADGSKPEPPDGVTLAPVGDRHVLHGDFGGAAAETVAEALNAFTRPPTAEDGTSLAVRQAEGFVRICEVALARGTDAEGSRPVVSYMTQARTDDDVTEPLTLGSFTGVVDPRERDRILCDARLVPITSSRTGEILDVGRATSVWNRATRRAMAARSPHCQWPGCGIPAPWCDAHHFQHWEHGGVTSLANGVQLCRRHHTFLHRHRDWSYTFDDQELRVFRPDGSEVHRDAWHGLAA